MSGQIPSTADWPSGQLPARLGNWIGPDLGDGNNSTKRNWAKRMKKILATIAFLLLLGSDFTAAAESRCDRPCLVALMDQYLAALAKHDPSGVPLAHDVIFVENTAKTPIGKGLWTTATKEPDEFKIYAADPVGGQVGFIGVVQENNKPAILGARLKLVDGKITEIDHLVVHRVREPLTPNLQKPRPGLLQRLKPSERVSREQMLKIANSYYEAIEQDNGKVAPFADDCQRRENGGTSANNQEKPPEGAKEDSFAVFGRMSCSDQLSTGVMSYITKIDQRRLLTVDEEMGLVFAFSMFNHSGEPKVMKIIGVPGITERPNIYGPFNLPAAHIFKIRNGQIHEIEAIGYVAPYGTKNGWE
jgi:hypothetical protein